MTSAAQFAITTTFTPPATCTTDHLTLLPSSLSYYIYLNYPDPIPETTFTDCYPSQFISSYLQQKSHTTPLAAIEPFICPVGYSEVSASPSVSGYLACCPSGFLLHQGDSPIGTRPAFGATCYSDINTVLVTAYGDDAVTATSTYSGAPGAQAYALPMEGYASAATTTASGAVATSFVITGASTAIATSSPTSTSTASTSSTSKSSHAGAIAGGVIGGIAGLLIVLGLVFFLYRRQRRQLSNQRSELEQKPPMYKHESDSKEVPRSTKNRAEMGGGGGSYPVEKDATQHPPAELSARPHSVQQLSELQGSEGEMI